MSQEFESIFLFSSGQRQLYRQDIYDVLSYPENFIMHFRYRKDWVDEKIWMMEPKHLAGEKGLIIAISQNDDGIPEFFPLRFARVISAEKEGEAILIYFELIDKWVEYSENIDYDKEIKKFPNAPRKEEGNDYLIGKFVLLGDVERIKISSSDIAWNRIVEKIGNKKPFQNGIFFRLAKLVEAQSKVEIAISQIDDYDNLRGYSLKGGNRYILEIAFNFGKEPPVKANDGYFKIEIPDLMKVIPNSKRLGFRIDKQKFNLSPEKIFRSQLIYLSTKIDNNNNIEGPYLEIPIKLENSSEAYFFGLLILIGLFLLSGVIQEYGPWDLTEYNFYIKIIGTLFSSIGTWLLTTSYKR